MVKVAVVGATGYTGEEIIKILCRHPKAELTSLAAIIDKPTNYATLFPYFKGKVNLICKELDIDETSKLCDLVFLALPHKISMEIAPAFLKKGKRVIDLSADYRLKDAHLYKKWYGAEHKDEKNLKAAVYGLPEFFKKEIEKADLIANPGCYPTGILLATLPFVKAKSAKVRQIIADAKTGVTGAGRRPDVSLSFAEIDGNFKAYKVNQHQHSPEINQELSNAAGKKIEIVFVPHLAPMQRGILSTIYLELNGDVPEKEVRELYQNTYKDKPFVRVMDKGSFPEIKNVANTNYCDIGIKVEEEKGLVIIVSAIDNLGKGAAGQAVQNMNVMCGFDEKLGLISG